KAHVLEHLGGGGEDALVGFEAEALVRLDGVEALVLQFIGLELVDEADAAAFLREIEQYACAMLADDADGAAYLIAAIAFERAQQVAGETFRMQAHENGTRRLRLADDQRQ